MTKFETIGVNRQHDACSEHEARKYFEHSCNCCCAKGMKLNCDKCAVAYVHSLVVACFNNNKGA